jgi:hypothetical protein
MKFGQCPACSGRHSNRPFRGETGISRVARPSGQESRGSTGGAANASPPPDADGQLGEAMAASSFIALFIAGDLAPVNRAPGERALA